MPEEALLRSVPRSEEYAGHKYVRLQLHEPVPLLSCHIPVQTYAAELHTGIHSSYLLSAHPANAGLKFRSESVVHCPPLSLH